MSEKQNLSQANLKLSLWNIRAESTSSGEVYMQLGKLGLPEEVVSRLHQLISFTKEVSGKVFAIGKVVVLRILEFIKAHPLLVASAGIAAVIGAAITTLVTSIPFLGTILAPIAIALGISITAAGAVIGHRLDKKFQDVGEDLAEVVTDFFTLIITIFNTVFGSDNFDSVYSR